MEIPDIKLSPFQAEILDRLLKRTCLVHTDSVEDAVRRMRPKLRPWGIIIETFDEFPCFYRLTRESKAILRGMMKKEAA